jgi:hypothetical protein
MQEHVQQGQTSCRLPIQASFHCNRLPGHMPAQQWKRPSQY